MSLLNQVVTEEEVAVFRQHFQDNFDKTQVNWQGDHQLPINKNHAVFQIVQRIVSNNFKTPTKVYAGYWRQTNMDNIHIDVHESGDDLYRYTYVLAMDTVPEFKTIIWKEQCVDNSSLHTFIADWGRMRRFKKKISNLSEIEDLEHTFDANQQSYMSDYLVLDEIYVDQIGTACLFDSTQLHCVSNWKKYNKFPHRELLQIHVETDTKLA